MDQLFVHVPGVHFHQFWDFGNMTVMDTPSLEVFKARLDVASSNQQWKASLPVSKALQLDDLLTHTII